jgi:hypothetical protein
MRTRAILVLPVVLLLVLASSAIAAVIHDESVNGDLSSDPNLPTPLVFPLGGSTVIGTTTSGDRDYITFTLGANQVLVGLNLLVYSPDNISFAAFNAGTTSHIPGAATNALFLSGIHVDGSYLNTNLMNAFVTDAVTTNHLPAPQLGPGDYCFVIQQTNAIITSYSLEFVVEVVVPTDNATWGAVKALYR